MRMRMCAHTTPHLATPHHTSPRHATPHHTTTSHHATPHHTTPHHTTPHHTRLHHTTPHHKTTPTLGVEIRGHVWYFFCHFTSHEVAYHCIATHRGSLLLLRCRYTGVRLLDGPSAEREEPGLKTGTVLAALHTPLSGHCEPAELAAALAADAIDAGADVREEVCVCV